MKTTKFIKGIVSSGKAIKTKGIRVPISGVNMVLLSLIVFSIIVKVCYGYGFDGL